MRTSIDIDDDIMQAAMDASGIRTKKGVVEQAIREFVATRAAKSLATGTRKPKKNIADLFGKIRFADGYDPRAPWGGFPPPPASSEPFSLAPGQGVTLAELEAELEAEER